MTPLKYEMRSFHVTFALKKGKIIAIACNKQKTHPITIKYNYVGQVNVHSELSAIIKLGRENCSELTFVNVRIKKDGTIGNSKPCPGCSDLLRQVGFKNLFFTDSNGKFQKIKKWEELKKIGKSQCMKTARN